METLIMRHVTILLNNGNTQMSLVRILLNNENTHKDFTGQWKHS